MIICYTAPEIWHVRDSTCVNTQSLHLSLLLSLCFKFLLFYFVVKTKIVCDLGLPRMPYDPRSWPKYQKILKCSLKPYVSQRLYLRPIESSWKGFMKHWISRLTGLYLWFQIFTSFLRTFFTKLLKLLGRFYFNLYHKT